MGVQSNKPFLPLGHRDSIVGVFFSRLWVVLVGVIVALMVNWMKLEGKTHSHPLRVLRRGTAKVRRRKILMGKVSNQVKKSGICINRNGGY